MLAVDDPTFGSEERRPATTDSGVVVAVPEGEGSPPSGDERSSSSSSSSPTPTTFSSTIEEADVSAPVVEPPIGPRSEPLLAPPVDIPPGPMPGIPPGPPFIGPPEPDELARPLGYPAPGSAPGLPPRRERAPRKRRVAEGKRPAPEGRWIAHRLRHIGPWSVLKVASLFFFCLFLTFVVAIVLLWNVGRSTETIDQFEGFVTRLGAYGTCTPEGDLDPGTAFERDDDCPDGEVLVDGFKLQDATLFRVVFFGGVVIVVGGTLGVLLLTVLFNLLNDVTGGLRYTTIREPVSNSPPSRSSRSSRSPRHQSRR